MHGTSWDLSAQRPVWLVQSPEAALALAEEEFAKAKQATNVGTANCVKWCAMYPCCDPHNSETFLDIFRKALSVVVHYQYLSTATLGNIIPCPIRDRVSCMSSLFVCAAGHLECLELALLHFIFMAQ